MRALAPVYRHRHRMVEPVRTGCRMPGGRLASPSSARAIRKVRAAKTPNRPWIRGRSMKHMRCRTAVCLIAAWLTTCSIAGSLAHPTRDTEHNELGGCASLGDWVTAQVSQWCVMNDKDGCNARFRSWVLDVERRCSERRRESGCSPNLNGAVEWHLHGLARPGLRLSLHLAVPYCEKPTQSHMTESVTVDVPPGLDREARSRVQAALAAQGFYPGQPEGEFDPRTRRAIQAWQQANGYTATGVLTSAQVVRLLTTPESGHRYYGSIASEEVGIATYAFGIAWSEHGHETARRNAVEECRRLGGIVCPEIGRFRNKCGAIAIGDWLRFGTGGGATNAEAESSALYDCRPEIHDCSVEVSRCVGGDYRWPRAAADESLDPERPSAVEDAGDSDNREE